MGFPIRKSADQSLFSAPRSLSQSTTSFIASCRQGIHQTPLLRLIRSRRRWTGRPGGRASPQRHPLLQRRRAATLSMSGSYGHGPHLSARPDHGQCHLTWERRPPAGPTAPPPRLAPGRGAEGPRLPWEPPGVSSVFSLNDVKPEGRQVPPVKGKTNNLPQTEHGGCGRTRTSDLTLIRRTL